MSETLISVMDMNSSGMEFRALRDEILTMHLDVKRRMDAGLTPDEMAVTQKIFAATEAAGKILEKL
ncbi:MAG: hypothetical protein K6E31_06495 [bacterium]|nr:hypothetical protein [bacterium]